MKNTRSLILFLHVIGLSVLPLGGTAAGVGPGNPDFSRVTLEVDKNADGKMSRQEWTSAGLPTSSFNMFEKGRGYVTQEDYEKNPAPAGIDGNGDGFLTVDEFIEFDKKMSAGGPPGAPPPPQPGTTESVDPR